ncbi:lipase family protein [Sorangium sp. So ce1000]|uniref:lipase family protein n=1 Tax=Sorangium sp. So ce1000 TaxID=3133325 RepID=UPI003F5FD1E0
MQNPSNQFWKPVAANWLGGPLGQYDASVASALCSVSTWAYADLLKFTFSTTWPAFVYVMNDVLFMDHRAWFIQSEDGRVVILCFRGTPPLDVIAWLGNFAVRPDPFFELGKVHGGFGRAMTIMFPPIQEILVRAGLTLENNATDSIRSIADVTRSLGYEFTPRERRPLDPVERYALIKRWASDPEELIRILAANADARVASLLQSEAVTRLCSANDPWQAVFDSTQRVVQDLKSFTDALRAADAAELKGVLERELQNVLADEVRKAIYETRPQPKRYPLERLYITGHSLGGAMAVLAAARLFHEHPEEMKKKLGGVYTYGQPMVGDQAFAERCEADFGSRLFRHIFRNDVVPHWPPRSTGAFKHAGKKEYWSSPDGWTERTSKTYQTLTMLWSLPVSLSAFFLEQLPFLSEALRKAPLISAVTNLPPFQHSIFDHLPINYLRTSLAPRVDTEIMLGSRLVP